MLIQLILPHPLLTLVKARDIAVVHRHEENRLINIPRTTLVNVDTGSGRKQMDM